MDHRHLRPSYKLRSARNFGNARFGKFTNFDFSTPEKKKNRQNIRIEKSVFRQFGEVLEDLRPNGRQNQLPHEILLQIDLFWGLYDQKLLKSVFFDAKQAIVIYGPSYKTLGRSIDRIEMNIESIESKKRKMPLLKELSRTSWDSFESESDSKESRDVRLNSFKNGIVHFCNFWAN